MYVSYTNYATTHKNKAENKLKAAEVCFAAAIDFFLSKTTDEISYIYNVFNIILVN